MDKPNKTKPTLPGKPKKLSIPELEKKIWSSIQRAAKRGLSIKDRAYGVQIELEEPDEYDGNSPLRTIIIQNDCRCALSSCFTINELKQVAKEERLNDVGELYNILAARKLGLRQDEANGIIEGFDCADKDMIAFPRNEYAKLGHRLRQKAQQLSQWHGSIG